MDDAGRTIGMTVCLLRDDVESAVGVIDAAGFEAVETYLGHLGPGMPGVAVREAHAAAVGKLIRDRGLGVSSLNAVGAESFAPHAGADSYRRSVDTLAGHLRLAAAMGSPRVLVWDGRVEAGRQVPEACAALARCIRDATDQAGLEDPPAVSIELHPFTFALAHRQVPRLAEAMRSVGAGICLDFCHAAIAGADAVAELLSDEILDAVNHVHYADSDGQTPELHVPPGSGMVDLAVYAERLAGRNLSVAWDLFGWPEPRQTFARGFAAYAEFVAQVGAGAVRR